MRQALILLLLSAAPLWHVQALPDPNLGHQPGATVLRERVEPWLKVKSASGPSGWMPAHQAWPALSFSRVAQVGPSAHFYKKLAEEPATNPLKSDVTVPILSSNPPWFEVRLPSGEARWSLFEDLKPVEKDLGFGYLLKNLQLKIKGQNLFLPKGIRFKPLALRNTNELQAEIIEGPHSGKKVWLNKADTLSKLNFAQTLKTNQGDVTLESAGQSIYTLQSVKTPGRWLFTGQKPLPLYEAPSMEAKVLTELPASSPLALMETDLQIWSLSPSMTKGVHWWLKHSVALKTQPQSQTLSSQEVFSRPIFDMASTSKGDPLAVVSAGGIFLRQSGSLWTPIPQFAGTNYPVTVTPAGDLLVGDHISRDRGQTFEPFIAWNLVLKELPQKASLKPKILKIQALDARGQHLIYHLDLGQGHLASAETRDQGQSWTVLPL